MANWSRQANDYLERLHIPSFRTPVSQPSRVEGGPAYLIKMDGRVGQFSTNPTVIDGSKPKQLFYGPTQIHGR